VSSYDSVIIISVTLLEFIALHLMYLYSLQVSSLNVFSIYSLGSSRRTAALQILQKIKNKFVNIYIQFFLEYMYILKRI